VPKKFTPAIPGYDGPRKTALESIRLLCVGCMGGSPSLVTDCQSMGCMFFPYRSGVIEAGASRRLLKVIKGYCDACAPGGDVTDCTAGKGYLSLSACPVWPFRRGVSPYFSAQAREQRRLRAISLFATVAQEADSHPRFVGTRAKGATVHPAGWCGAL
jgi:hypothetical protein